MPPPRPIRASFAHRSFLRGIASQEAPPLAKPRAQSQVYELRERRSCFRPQLMRCVTLVKQRECSEVHIPSVWFGRPAPSVSNKKNEATGRCVVITRCLRKRRSSFRSISARQIRPRVQHPERTLLIALFGATVSAWVPPSAGKLALVSGALLGPSKRLVRVTSDPAGPPSPLRGGGTKGHVTHDVRTWKPGVCAAAVRVI